MITRSKPKWGGARQGAGRKRISQKTVKVTISIPEDMRLVLKKLGGTKWIQDQIQRIEDRQMAAKIDTTKFDEEEQDLFIEGWKDAGGYVGDLEAGVDCPWCCPWDWCETIEVTGTDIKGWGRQFWEECREEIEGHLKKEAEMAKEMAEEEA